MGRKIARDLAFLATDRRQQTMHTRHPAPCPPRPARHRRGPGTARTMRHDSAFSRQRAKSVTHLKFGMECVAQVSMEGTN